MTKSNDYGLLLLRISVAGLMLFHGVAKLTHGIDGLVGMIGPTAYAVYIGEVLAPLAMLIGYRTRIAALIFAINCLVAAFLAHSADFFKIDDHGGYALELLALYFFGGVVLFFTGAGKYALSSKSKWD